LINLTVNVKFKQMNLFAV